MVSSSSSSSSSSSTNMIPANKHDVFLSFRGEDTRDNFTSHLYTALCRKQIETFIDNQLIKGAEISQVLLNAIEGSNISVIIFSEGYSASAWCLDELVKILECKNKYGQIVIPIFYGVDPSHVRKQTGIFGSSFSKLEERFRKRIDKLQKWRIALREVADLSGFDSRIIRPESELIEKIIDDILKRMKRMNHMLLSDSRDQLVGVESRILEIELLLNVGSKDIYTLGIWGIGGIGKTTIATAIFNKISSYFEGSCFVQNVREESDKVGGLAHLQRRLLSTLLEDENVKIDISNIDFNFRRLSRKKVLIVFDDVTNFGQIESLIGGLHYFGVGSRIIITTRDKQVLQICRVDEIYKVSELEHDDAVKLFRRHAFGQNHSDVAYEKLSSKIIKYAQGVPLALKVLGRFLFGRSKESWESAVNKLERIPHMDIQKVLKMSYDGLDDKEQNIFLDIACFFKGEDKDLVVKFLDASGFFPEIGISVLVDKSLIIISNNHITMHDLLQEMGREIVRQESVNDPGKRSRLWHHEDIYDVLTYNTGTKAIEGISLDMSKVNNIHLNPGTFTKMHNLRFIKLYGDNVNKMHHFEDLESVFKELRYFHWRGCPLNTLPSNILPENLVLLEFPKSKVEQLWDGVQNLVNIKKIDLSDSKNLMELPDLSLAQNIEKLNLNGCSSLVETHPSIQYLNKLVTMDLSNCIRLKSLPTRIHSKSLEDLFLLGCSNLKSFPEISSCNIKRLHLDASAIETLPSFMSKVVFLDLKNCSRFEQLPCSLCKLKSLGYLDLPGFSNLWRLPDEPRNSDTLMKLHAERISLRQLLYLNNLIEYCHESFRSRRHMGFILPISLSLDGLHSVKILKPIDCRITELPESLGPICSLEQLYVEENNSERITKSIKNLSRLGLLYLSNSDRLSSSTLSLLFTLPTSFDNYQKFDLNNCMKLDRNELKKIAGDAIKKIQITAAALWKEPDQTHYHIGYRGSEIPEWFKFQNTGYSITLKLPPPEMFVDKFVGFGFCAVVAFEDHHIHRQFEVWCEWKVRNEDRDWHGAASAAFLLFGGIIGYVDSDYVLLGYQLSSIKFLDRFKVEYCYNNEGYFEFYLLDTLSRERMECCEVVKKCGIHLFYHSDFERSMEDFSGSFSSDEEKYEPPPHPKRFNYSTSSF